MKKFEICDRVSVVALSLSVFLGIVAFIPGGFMSGNVLKGYFLIVSVLVAFVSWLLGRLFEGSFRIPWTPMFLGTILFILALFLSGLFSHTMYLSLLGENFEQGTFAVFGSMLLGLALISMLFNTKKRVSKFLQMLVLTYGVLALYQIVHLIFPSVTSFNIFNSVVDTPVGVWSDFGFISGAALIGFVLMIQFMNQGRMLKVLSYIGALIALFFVALTNIMTVWVLVGISSVFILIYVLIVNRQSEERHFSFVAFILSLIALFFILANNLVGGTLANALNASFVDVHPSLSASIHVSGLSLSENPIFGAGPNRFLGEWLRYRPVGVNLHTLWDIPFSSGSSLFMTVGFLGGIVGILAMIFFVLSFFYESVRKVFNTENNPERNIGLMFSLFILALYFMLALVLYSPGISVTIMALAFVGVFFGFLVEQKLIAERTVMFLRDQRSSFFSILLIVGFLMISAGTAYLVTERFASIVFYQKALRSASVGDYEKADRRLAQAIGLADLPLFQRARVVVAEKSIQKTLAIPEKSISEDVAKALLQSAVSVGTSAARQAVSLDPSDPVNYIVFGDLFRMLAPLKIEGVFQSSLDAYNKAIEIAPNYPKTYLNIAELYYNANDYKNARIYVEKALTAKANYTGAYFLLSQIETATGNTSAAIKRLQDATLVDPNNPDAYFELGLLYYQNGRYSDSVSALRSAVNLNSQYMNAWYFLALADKKIGEIEEATKILEALSTRFPDSVEVSNALSSLSSNDSKNSDTVEPDTTTTKKDKAKKLPIPTDTSAKPVSQ
ncbi:MAG: tetratricopeptide repeat protein [Candidatus Pacebacteria bacterium]|nr:tetratricopeptide repeat protein [Candidatus Paceibacterota bacterium]